MQFFDAHTHAQFSAFDEDRDEVMQRASDAGVVMLNVGTERRTSAGAIALAERYDGAYAAVGLHPIHTSRSFHDAEELGGGDAAKAFTSKGEVFDGEYYRDLARHPKVVAIGECGLDYFRLKDDDERGAKIAQQKEAFLEQISLSRQLGKPLMIHCRNAFPDLIAILKSNRRDHQAGVVHFFTGTADEARELLDLGFSFTFGGVVTFARDYDEVIRTIPMDRILSETDAPYLTPTPHRGTRNEPVYVVETVKKLAGLKGISPEEMAATTVANAKRIFNV